MILGGDPGEGITREEREGGRQGGRGDRGRQMGREREREGMVNT